MAVQRTKRPVQPDPDEDERNERVENDPRVKRARERLRQSNAAKNGDDDDDDAAPDPEDEGGEVIRGGWTASHREMDATSQWASAFKPDEKSQVIKFLEDTPYASFRRHWIERSGPSGRTLRAYTCLKSVNKECPLCEIGERPQAVSAFNIAIVGDDGQLVRKSWDVGARLLGVIEGHSNDPKVGPLTKGYFGVSKTGKRQTVQYNILPIKAAALEEDYDITRPTDAEIAAVERYTAEIVEIPKMRDMKMIAQELTEEYD